MAEIAAAHDGRYSVDIHLKHDPAASRAFAEAHVRRLEAMLTVADATSTLITTGAGDVLEPEFGIAAIGSGGSYAQAAARALLEHTELAPEEIVRESLGIASDICIYTNRNFTIETLA